MAREVTVIVNGFLGRGRVRWVNAVCVALGASGDCWIGLCGRAGFVSMLLGDTQIVSMLS